MLLFGLKQNVKDWQNINLILNLKNNLCFLHMEMNKYKLNKILCIFSKFKHIIIKLKFILKSLDFS